MCSFGGILQHFVWYDSSNKDLFIREGVTPMVFVITGNNSERLRKWSELVCKTHTLWNDITVSHTAVDSLQNSKNSQEFYSFFSDLKQWADDSERKIRICDLQGHEEVLKDFMEIDDDSLNPIELYAYYLGLYINNMRNGIYLNYVLSYPVKEYSRRKFKE